jgi:hypothetical protein
VRVDNVLGCNCGASCIDVVVSGKGFADVILSGGRILGENFASIC